MSWHYIVIRKKLKYGKRTQYSYTIHEGYEFDKNGIPKHWTESSVCPRADTLDDLRKDLCTMLMDSLRYPIYEERGNKLVICKE